MCYEDPTIRKERNLLTWLLLAVIAALSLFLVGTARAGHHPFDICQPQVGELPDPFAANCAKTNEPQNHTFSLGNLQVGDTIWVPMRFNDTREALCEVGMQMAYPTWGLDYEGMWPNLDAYEPHELEHIPAMFCSPSGDTCATMTNNVPPPGFASFEGANGSFPVNTAECPECFWAAHQRLWSYTGPGRNPVDLFGNRDRIWAWWKFTVDSIGEGLAHRMAVSDGWIAEPVTGGDGTCDCGNSIDENGRGCNQTTTMETWTDMPDGLETNQVFFTTNCHTADHNRDGVISIADFGIQKAGTGTTGYYAERRCDFDDDGDCDVVDFGVFKQRYNAGDASCH